MTSTFLVTGADGFIGSQLTEMLLDHGHTVRAFCIYNSLGKCGWLEHSRYKDHNRLELVLGDIRDPDSVMEAMNGCQIVFHLAALIAIPYSYNAPSSYIATNIIGTLNALQAARAHSASHFIHTSTSETYGTAQYVPITEQHPLSAQSPYAATKIAADQLALSFWHSFSLPVTVVRPFNTYGPRQSARAVIPTIISQLLTGSRQIKLGATSPTRDFNYVSDTCSAFISVANNQSTFGKVLNAASGFEVSIGDTVSLICRILNSDAEIISDESRLRPVGSEVNRLFGDSSLLQELTGWRPNYAGIDGFQRGLETTIDWFKQPENIRHYKPNLYTI